MISIGLVEKLKCTMKESRNLSCMCSARKYAGSSVSDMLYRQMKCTTVMSTVGLSTRYRPLLVQPFEIGWKG